MAMTNFRAEDMPGAKKAAAPAAKKADKKSAPAPKKAEKVEAPVVDEVVVDEVVETESE